MCVCVFEMKIKRNKRFELIKITIQNTKVSTYSRGGGGAG